MWYNGAIMKRPDMNPPVHCGSLFTWHRTSPPVGTCELSDLPRMRAWTRVWSDACDVGFWVTSPRSGMRLLFTLQTEHRDDEGDTTFFEFATECGIRIHVFND